MFSIYTLIISIGLSVSPDASFAKKLPDSKKMLQYSGITFVLGLAVLFGAITLTLFGV
jgi:hypothetical protein